MKPIIQDKNFKILIVDDDPTNIQIVASILQKEGYRMTFAPNGKKALENAYENNLDLILLDILMPEMDGFEVCRKLKESPTTVDIPVIFLTVKDEVEEIIKGFELGAVDYVTKPFNSAELLARVRAHAKSKKLRDSQDLLISKLKTALEERKRAEDAFIKAEEKYRSIFENAIEGIFQTTPEGRYIQMNPAFANMFGYASPEEMVAQVTDIGKQLYVDPMERERLKDVLSSQGYVKGFEAEQRRKDGTKFWISINAYSVQDVDGTVLYYEGTNVDITDRKHAEEALRKAEVKYRSIFENAMEGIYQSTPDGHYIEINPAFARIFGYDSPNELKIDVKDIGQLYLDKEKLNECIRILKENGSGIFEVQIRRKDGSIGWVSNNVQAVMDSSGKIAHFEGVVEDITKRKWADEALQESERKFRAIYEGSHDAIMLCTEECFIFDCNERALKMFGMESKKEINKIHPAALSPPIQPGGQDSVSAASEQIQTAFRNGHNHFEWVHRRKNGEDFYAEVSLSPFDYGGQTVLQATVRDITERKRMEEELLKSQKLESISILAGGIAHDFNNLLGAITGYIGLSKIYMNPEDVAYRNLEKAEQACLHASELTKQLITFSHGGEYLRKEISLAELLKELCCFTLSGSNVRCDLSLPDALWPIVADARQVSQVAHHLLKNAQEAMKEGGVIVIRALNRTVTKDDGMPLKVGKYVEWSVEDHGVGIPRENLSKIFDPYFTTKGRGSTKGMGLGLAICYSVINRHNGLITVSSEPGFGTVFTVYLPAAVSDR
jgi:PAS domain S-box-containing protein